MTDLQLLTIRDVMNITKLGRTKIYELLRDGELPCIRIGRSVRIRRDELEAWLERRRDDKRGPAGGHPLDWRR